MPHEARALADPERVKRLLAIKPHDQLGDFLLATPALHAVRRRYPRATLWLLTRDLNAPLAWRNHDLDRVLILPRLGGLTGLRRLTRFANVVAAVARFEPDLVFVLNSVSRSRSADALAALSRARLVVGRSTVGPGPIAADAPADAFASALEPATPRDPVYDLDLPVAAGSEHQVDRYGDLVRWTGAEVEQRPLRLDLSAEERTTGAQRLAEALGSRGARAARRIGIHPGAANPLKCWPLESFVALSAALAIPSPDGGQGAALAVFDSPREAGRAAAVREGLAARGVPAGFIPAGPIESFAAVSSALDLLVCNDSGVMHIAAALGVPTVSFHSLGRPAEWAPRGDHAIAFWSPREIGSIPVAAAVEAARGLLRASERERSAGC